MKHVNIVESFVLQNRYTFRNTSLFDVLLALIEFDETQQY